MGTDYSKLVKNIFHEYYNRDISMGEYRAKRKAIIDQMDNEYNGAGIVLESAPPGVFSESGEN